MRTDQFYVVRIPRARTMRRRESLIVESRPFVSHEDATGWVDFIQHEHPRDEVYVVQIVAPTNVVRRSR